jgi:large repetitive protein
VNAAATTTTITGKTPNPSTVGQAVTVNFTVAAVAPGAGTPTGNVTVSDGSATCTGTVAAGTCTLTPTTAGAKTVTATYAGDGNFTGSTSAGVAQTVNVANTATTITGHTPNPSTLLQGIVVTFTVAAVAPGSGTPTGNVTVSDGTATCTGTVAAGTCTLTPLTIGVKTLVATYAGDANFAGSTSPGVSHTVNP